MMYQQKKNKHSLAKLPPRFNGTRAKHPFSVYKKDGDNWVLMAYSIPTFEAAKSYVGRTGTPGAEFRVFEREKMVKHWRFPTK